VADCNAGIEFSGGGLRLGTPKGHFLASLFDRRADYEVYASRRQKTHEGKLPKVTILPGRLVSNEPLQAAITSISRQAWSLARSSRMDACGAMDSPGMPAK